jgi:hypothetical protein
MCFCTFHIILVYNFVITFRLFCATRYFIVRKPINKPASDIIVQTLDPTWQAYNPYRAPNTYGVDTTENHWKLWRGENEIWEKGGIRKEDFEQKIPDVKGFDKGNHTPPLRSYVTSYNRPIITRQTRAVNTVFNAEYPWIRFLEMNGFDVSYVSALDVHLGRLHLGEAVRKVLEKNIEQGNGHFADNMRARRIPIDAPKIFLSIGHDEYWSSEQRKNIELARDEGINLGFFSANEAYWNVRWERGPMGKLISVLVLLHAILLILRK